MDDHKAPAPFNPDFDPNAAARYTTVSESMEADGFYDANTREECSVEWRKRYDALKINPLLLTAFR